MCGIYGITSVDVNFIKKYIEVCKHRGPDGSDVWHDDRVTLGHNLLSIMGDANKARQPWTTPKGNVLVYNGEIFNYYELLEKYKNVFQNKTDCDTELLAWGLDCFGIQFVEQLDSMHGFAYYDKEQQKLILSRDHAGIKPVYYAEVKEGLVFGSEIKGMLDKVPGSRKLDKVAHSIFCRLSANPLRNTFFNNIKKLLPGETLVYNIRNKKILQNSMDWVLPVCNKDYNTQEVRQQVHDAVKRCSIGNKKIGLFLSGGMDSSMIGYELKNLHGTVNSFTNGWDPDPYTPEERYNEDFQCAEKMAKELGYNHTKIIITPEIYKEYWDQSIASFEQIIKSPSMPANIYTNKIMKDNNIKVSMAGDLGDELLCGYPRHKLVSNERKRMKSWRHVCDAMINFRKFDTGVNKDILSHTDTLALLEKTYTDKLFNPEDPLGSFNVLEILTNCPEEFLLRNDKFGMNYSIEGRYPLASKTFMKYCMSIHSDYKLYGVRHKRTAGKKFMLKHMSKTAYKDYLPEYIINKGKTGWTVPMGYWMNNKNFQEFYKQKTGKDMTYKISQKTGKWAASDMIWASWFKMFNVENY